MGFQLTPLTALVMGTPAQQREATHRIHAAVQASSGNMKQAALALGVSRATLYNYCERLGLSREEIAHGRHGQKGGEPK